MDGTPFVDRVALRSEITDFLACEAQAVDDRDWDTWLDLHEETVEGVQQNRHRVEPEGKQLAVGGLRRHKLVGPRPVGPGHELHDRRRGRRL